MLGPGIVSRAAVRASHTHVLDNDDKPYLYVTMLGTGTMSRAAVPASCTHDLDNGNKP
jgi:hypothetical protein